MFKLDQENGHNHTDEDSDYDENDEKKEIELTVMWRNFCPLFAAAADFSHKC